VKKGRQGKLGYLPLRSLRSRVIVRTLFPYPNGLVSSSVNEQSLLYLLDDTSAGKVRHTEVTVTTHKDRTGEDIVLKRVAGRGGYLDNQIQWTSSERPDTTHDQCIYLNYRRGSVLKHGKIDTEAQRTFFPSTHFLSPISRSHASAASKNDFCSAFPKSIRSYV
jgi:hypothetical protein